MSLLDFPAVPHPFGPLGGADVACPIPQIGNALTYLYAVHRPDVEEIKFGVSLEPWMRLGTLQVAHGSKLRMVLAVPAVPDDERAVHREFAHARLLGEWFRVTDDLAEWVKEARSVAEDMARGGVVNSRQPLIHYDQKMRHKQYHGALKAA